MAEFLDFFRKIDISQLEAKYLELAKMLGLSPELFGVVIAVAVFFVLYLLRGIAFFRFLMRWMQRIIVIAALCGLGVWMFYIGREHQIFLDNKTFGDYKALEQVNVSVNGGDVAELMARERDVRKAVGPKFELKAEIFDEDGSITNTITKTIAVDFSRDIMINLPALVGGSEEYIVPAPR